MKGKASKTRLLQRKSEIYWRNAWFRSTFKVNTTYVLEGSCHRIQYCHIVLLECLLAIY